MRNVTIGAFLVLGWVCGICSAAAPPDTLTLADLTNHPERWPATVTLARDFTFTNGVSVHSGDKLHMLRYDGQHAVLVAPKNMLFGAAPADCGLLDAANAVWSALTPAQRAIDPASLPANMSLWPVKVTTNQTIKGNFGSLPAESEVDLLDVTDKGYRIIWPKSTNALLLDYTMTDLIDQARKLSLIDPEKRPSRIANALENVMLDADGKPFKDEHLQDKKIFAFYFGAGWCQPCRDFSPDLVKFASAAMAAHPELSIVMLNEDKSDADMLAYMKDEKMPFPAVAPKTWQASRLLSSYVAEIIPQFTVVDRFGKVLASNDDQKGNRGDPNDAVKALQKILDQQATTKPG